MSAVVVPSLDASAILGVDGEPMVLEGPASARGRGFGTTARFTAAAAGAVVLAVAVSLPLPAIAHGAAAATASLLGLAWVAAGIRRHCPGSVAWRFLVAAVALGALATLAWYAPVFAGGGARHAQPSLVDPLRIVADLLLAGTIMSVIAMRERPLMVLLDIASIVIAGGLVLGVAIVEPALAREGSTALRIADVAYTVAGLALVAAVLRVLLTPRGRPAVLWALVAAAACIVASDVLWGQLMADGNAVPRGARADIGWSLYPLVLGLAALHPSMGRLGTRSRRTDGELTVAGPLILGLTSLVAPMMLGAHALGGDFPGIDERPADGVALLAGGLLLGTLFAARFGLLIRRARRLADRSEERYQKLVEEVPAVVVLYELLGGDAVPVPRYVSPQAEAIVGLSAADWVAHPEEFGARIDPADLEMLKAALTAQLSGAPKLTAPEFRVTGPGAKEIWLRDVSGVITERDDSLYLQVMLVDITESKRAESDRARMESELRLAQKLEAVGQLAAGIAHEINTPIQFVGDTIHFLSDAFGDLLELIEAYDALRLAAEAGTVDFALLERVREAELAADVEYLRERVPGAFERGADGVSRVATIVRAMREFAHPPTLEKAPVDVVAVLHDTLIVAMNVYRYVAEVETDFEELPAIMANGGELNQVFLNLVVNAAHAIETAVGDSGERGTIVLRARRDHDDVVVSVSDTGCGIPDDVAARVFDPFFTTKEVGRGTGQGLAIARTMIVERHGGALTFDTEPGRGTTFHVRLPIGEPMAVAA